MNKKIVIINSILIIISVSILCFTMVTKYVTRTKSANEIYRESLSSIVELKAANDDKEGEESFGTAIFVDEDGTLVTNAHVVTYSDAGAINTYPSYQIRFAHEEQYRSVELLRYDTDFDLAVLKLIDNNCEYTPCTMEEENLCASGDKVYAVGNSVNYGISISEGIVGIPIIEIVHEEKKKQVIQCDITITEGNSGGALLNANGKLLGVTTFRVKDNSGEVIHGLAYCIPVSVVQEYLKK